MEVLNGDYNISLSQILAILDDNDLATVSLPIDEALDIILDPLLYPTTFTHQMTVISEFTSTSGKFGDALGNVALIDCHYANRLIFNTYKKWINNMLDENPVYFIIL